MDDAELFAPTHFSNSFFLYIYKDIPGGVDALLTVIRSQEEMERKYTRQVGKNGAEYGVSNLARMLKEEREIVTIVAANDSANETLLYQAQIQWAERVLSRTQSLQETKHSDTAWKIATNEQAFQEYRRFLQLASYIDLRRDARQYEKWSVKR